MIEIIVINHLKKELNISVGTDLKEVKEQVVITKTSSSTSNLITSAMIAIKSYSDTRYKASLLNEKVKEAMSKLIENENVSSCKLNTDYDFTDTTTKQFRYQAVFDICFY